MRMSLASASPGSLLEALAESEHATPQLVVEAERHRIFTDVDESCLFIDEGSVVVESSDQRPRTAVYA